MLLSSFYEASVILISKLDKDNTNRKNYRSVIFVNIDINIINSATDTDFSQFWGLESPRSSFQQIQPLPGLYGHLLTMPSYVQGARSGLPFSSDLDGNPSQNFI